MLSVIAVKVLEESPPNKNLISLMGLMWTITRLPKSHSMKLTSMPRPSTRGGFLLLGWPPTSTPHLVVYRPLLAMSLIICSTFSATDVPDAMMLTSTPPAHHIYHVFWQRWPRFDVECIRVPTVSCNQDGTLFSKTKTFDFPHILKL